MHSISGHHLMAILSPAAVADGASTRVQQMSVRAVCCVRGCCAALRGQSWLTAFLALIGAHEQDMMMIMPLEGDDIWWLSKTRTVYKRPSIYTLMCKLLLSCQTTMIDSNILLSTY